MTMMNKTLPLIAAVFFTAALLISPAQAQQVPGEIVQQTVNEVLNVLADNTLSQAEKKQKAYEIAEQHINFQGMARRILALHWKNASDGQKQQFQELFKQLLLNTYWQRAKNYSGQRVEYITGMIEGNDFATIDTIIISDKVEIPITYRMELIDGKWLAYDFLIESLSLVTRYRNDYRQIIKSDGIDGLLEKMQQEVSASES